MNKLNEGLLLLAKIENNQYETTGKVRLAEITKKYVYLFAEFIKEKQLTIETNYQGEFMISLHPVLAGSLISNLLGNAIKYNYTGGMIQISVSENHFHISNTSLLKPIPSEKLFKRLKNSKESLESSNGLGLAIVKKIADVNNLRITYRAEKGLHSFDIVN